MTTVPVVDNNELLRWCIYLFQKAPLCVDDLTNSLNPKNILNETVAHWLEDNVVIVVRQS
ncbi:hypothetical protein BGX30_006273 [Mortierella sp. GBA39]|nr:hypothetical protein BGX30_006273 [Mortierella sp. GBA39]